VSRARLIKPGFFLNEELAEMPPLARLLFAGLWTIADREGRLKDRPKRIKAEVLPYDDCDVDAMLDSLAAAGFIIRYCVKDEPYLAVAHFLDHQTPHHKEVDSAIPAPTCDDAVLTSTLSQACANVEPTMPPVSISVPVPVPVPKTVSNNGAKNSAEAFDSFWKLYPKKVDKGHARKAFTAALKKSDLATILAGVTRYAESVRGTEPRYIAGPSPWLNGERWDDENVPFLPQPEADMFNGCEIA
jgi:hypothetical protein